MEFSQYAKNKESNYLKSMHKANQLFPGHSNYYQVMFNRGLIIKVNHRA